MKLAHTLIERVASKKIDMLWFGPDSSVADGSLLPETVRVFRDLRANSWSVDSAKAEAASDILATTTMRLLGVSNFGGDDPQLTSRDRSRELAVGALNELITQFEQLLSVASHEEELQVFIKAHPELLDLRAVSVDPKVRLGSEYVTDFIVTLPGQQHVLVEIERAGHRLFTGNHDPTSALSHSVQQVEDWLEWSHDNLAYLRQTYPDLHEPKGLVVIGRRSSLHAKDTRALRRRNALNSVRVVTYDDLLDDVRAVVANLMRVAKN